MIRGLSGKFERIGIVFPGGQKASGLPNRGFPVPEKSLQERCRAIYKSMCLGLRQSKGGHYKMSCPCL